MKRIFSQLLLFSIMLSSAFVVAQEQRIYNQFFMNPAVYNPAYVGVEGHTVFYVLYRNQWAGLNDAPTISNFNFHTPLKGGIGIGFEALNDTKADVLKTNEFKGSVSYLATFDNKHYLRFGLGLGMGSSGLDYSKLEGLDNNQTATLSNAIDQTSYMLGTFGATYHTGHFNIGISLPSLISSSPISSENFQTPAAGPLDNVLFKINYRGHLGDNMAIEPHLLYRYNSFGTSQLEATTILHILHRVWTGVSYAEGTGITGYAGFKIKDKMAVGAAFGTGKQDVSEFSGSTYEIKIGYHLGTRKKHAEHVSSFIKSHRKTLEERQAEAERKKQEKLLAEQAAAEAEEKRLAEIERRKQEIEERNADPVTEEAEIPTENEEKLPEEDMAPQVLEDVEREEIVNKNPTPSEEEIDSRVEETIAEETPTRDENITLPVQETQETNPVSNNEVIEKPQTPSTDQLSKSREPQRVKRGNSMIELPKGNYLIAGAFKEFDNAERFSDKIFMKGYYDSKVGFVSETGFYYVIVNNFDSAKEAEKTKNRLQRKSGFENSWVLIVE